MSADANPQKDTCTVKCHWCGTLNEPSRKLCRACGIPSPGESPTRNAPAGATTTSARKAWAWRGFYAVILLAPVLVGLTIGIKFLWQWQSRDAEVRRAQIAEEGHRLAEAERQRAAEAERQRTAEASRQREAELRDRIAQVLATAKDHLRRGNFSAGLAVVDNLLRDVDSAELRETRVDLLNNAGRWNEAYLELQKVLKSRPGEVYLHLAAMNFARTLNDPKAAVNHFEAATQLAPSNTTYQIGLANLYVESGRAEDGFGLFEKLLAEDPQCIDCWFNYGNSLFKIGRIEQTVAVFRQAVEKFPDSSQHRLHLAIGLDLWGRNTRDQAKLNEAAEHYRKSLELHPMPRSVAAQRIFEITGQRVPPELEAMSAEEVELQPAGNVNMVRVAINGVEGRFILDTGASFTCVFGQAARRFNLRPTRRVSETQTANGKIQVPVTYGAVRVGRQTQYNAIILVLPKGDHDGIDGLLGMDFLNFFNGRIETDHRRLILRGEKPGQ